MKLRSSLAEVIRGWGDPLVAVIGDVMLDDYAIGSAKRISQEAPIPILSWEDHEYRAGGAADVAVMLAALGARVRLAGVIGDDQEEESLLHILQTAGVNADGVLVDSDRCTTAKHRFIGRCPQRQPHQLLRMDREMVRPLPPHFRDKILRLLATAERPSAILISDYDKGVCHQGLAESVIGFGRERGIPVLVDPAPGGEFEPYLGASLVTPNRHEAQRATGKVIACPQQALEIGQELCRRLRLNAALIKLDKDGMALAYPQGAGRVFPTRARQICDVTGAGDMVLAVLGLCRASGVDLEEAVELANAAAGLEVERFGATPLARSELYHEISTGGRSANKIVSQEELLDLVALRRRSGQTVVFTNGCFDLLHPGHLSSLEQGAELGDCLVVALNDDESAERLKGPGRPVLSQEDRAAMVAALGCVDLVTVFDEPDPCTLLALLRPDVLFKGGDYPLEAVVGKELVESYGGRVFVTQATVDASSTKLIGRIRQMAFVS